MYGGWAPAICVANKKTRPGPEQAVELSNEWQFNNGQPRIFCRRM